MKIAPSILSADYSKLGEDIKKLERCDIDIIHIDVMDGHFVPNLTIGPVVVRAIRNKTKMKFDTHLMIENPLSIIDSFIDAGSDIITVHAEIEDYRNALQKIRDSGIKCGLALNPETSFSKIKDDMNEIDVVVIMTVNPGFAGKKFIPEVIPKITETKRYIEKYKLKVLVEVDGGIKDTNAGIVVKAGADIIVSGSFVFKNNIEKNISKLRTAIKNAIS